MRKSLRGCVARLAGPAGARAPLGLAILTAVLLAVPAVAQEAAEGGPVHVAAADALTPVRGEAGRGPVTNLPLPRFVSLKAEEGNARRGPSLSHRIDWVFVRPDMPLEITGEYGHWRRVRDRDGAGGWVHYSLLSGSRTVVVTDTMADLRAQPAAGSAVVARAEAGVVARLGTCVPNWCRVSAGGQRGWVDKSYLWGVGPDEIRE